jgi:sensor histidine kinase regulating citrate/malate metabolism
MIVVGNKFNWAHVSYADDGGGMDPNSLRKCMSLGYSSKKSKTTIGQCKCASEISLFVSLSSGGCTIIWEINDLINV